MAARELQRTYGGSVRAEYILNDWPKTNCFLDEIHVPRLVFLLTFQGNHNGLTCPSQSHLCVRACMCVCAISFAGLHFILE